MKKKIIPVLIAVILIAVIGAVWGIPLLQEQFGYSHEQADLDEYFTKTLPQLMYKEYQARTDATHEYDSLYGVSVDVKDVTGVLSLDSDRALLFLQNVLYPYQTGIIRDGGVYIPYPVVEKYLTGRFYYNEAEQCLKFTTPDNVQTVYLGSDPSVCEISSPDLSSPEVSYVNYDYPVLIREGEDVYLAAEYLTGYCSFSYQVYENPNRIQLSFGELKVKTATLKKDQAIRDKAGKKCDVLTNLKKGDTVYVMEGQFFDEWALVMTPDCFMGYIEFTDLENEKEDVIASKSTAAALNYPSISRDHKICLGWHQVLSEGGNDTLEERLRGTMGLNVISPTWLFVTGSEGELTDISSTSYVNRAHELGLEVWVLTDDFTKDNTLNALLSNTTTRIALENNLVNAVRNCGADGLNIDYEHINSDNGDNFAQFLRELSILTHKYNIVLSVDNYPPSGGSFQYRRDEQGIVVDYVIVMGYDEHWAGGGEAGSVASISYVENGIADTIAAGVPANKLINAIPFYTRIWQTEGSDVTCSTVDMPTSFDWISKHGIETTWDEETCQNYGSLQSGTALFEVWLEDTSSLQVKLTIMEKYNISGVACWKLGLEYADVWPLISGYLGL